MFMVFFGPLLYTDDRLEIESIPDALQSGQNSLSVRVVSKSTLGFTSGILLRLLRVPDRLCGNRAVWKTPKDR